MIWDKKEMPYRHGVRAKQRMGIMNVGKYINMEEILFHRIWKEQLIILKRHMIEVIRRQDINIIRYRIGWKRMLSVIMMKVTKAIQK